jgi:hypothetical protein
VVDRRRLSRSPEDGIHRRAGTLSIASSMSSNGPGSVRRRERPVRSRLRCGARLGRFDILLAPGEGRRYPNLSDHKKNVEYDVARVCTCSAMTPS